MPNDVTTQTQIVPTCRTCGTQDADDLPAARWDIGYRTCMPCADVAMRKRIRTVVPMHKSNYMLFTDPELLKQLNPKRTQA